MTDVVVVVIGAGIAGLTVAHRLQTAGVDVRVVERAPHAGGHMRTVQRQGWRHENGPNSFLGSAQALVSLAEDVGVTPIPARDVAKKRYLFLDGKLQALPTSPLGAITTGVLPFSAKLRALCEPFTATVPTDETSVREFFEQHFGTEITDRFVDAFAAGIYAGDIAEMGMAASFPRVYEQVRKHKSVLRAIPAMARSGKPSTGRRGTYSFAGGLGDLPAAIAAKLGDRLQVGADLSLSRDGSGWRVGAFSARAVVLATPPFAAADLLKASAPELAGALDGIAFNPIAGVHLLFPKSAVPRPLDGFGFLVPRREKLRLLGCIWSPSLFDVCDSEHVALTCFIGGARDPALVSLSEEEIIQVVRGDLKQTLRIADAPADAVAVRIPKAIPIYGRQHLATRARVESLAAAELGLWLTGNYLDGIAMNDTVAHGEKTAKAVLGSLGVGQRAA